MFTINAQRLQMHIEAMAQIGKLGETGTNRPAHSQIEKEAFRLAMQWMQAAGMQARIDNFGNLVGIYLGQDPSLPIIMLGSHLDSQPYGGRFDGVIGVLGAIEVVHTLHENKIIPKQSIHVISFSDEEGWRFNKGLYGSRGILGKLLPEDLTRKDAAGITRKEALEAFGCNLQEQKKDEYDPTQIQCFLELHIEQGPVLDNTNMPIGIVKGIMGALWLTVTINGVAGHAGSTPMPMRNDAMMAAAEIITNFRSIVMQDKTQATVGTVGTMQVFPASRNIIPEQVSFTVDLRNLNLAQRNLYEQELRASIETIAAKHKVTYSITEDNNSEPRYCAPWIIDIMHAEANALQLHLPEVISGPFHDALTLSYVTDYGMIFVRSKDGISHNPKEYSSYEDIALGAQLLYKTLVAILDK
jgi:allantoate deiminase